MNTQATHYKQQRDKLAYYLLNTLGLSKKKVGDILGIGRSAVALQFPTLKKGAVK